MFSNQKFDMWTRRWNIFFYSKRFEVLSNSWTDAFFKFSRWEEKKTKIRQINQIIDHFDIYDEAFELMISLSMNVWI